MNILSSEILKKTFKSYKESSLFGKWITLGNIEKLFDKHQDKFIISQLGFSEQKRPCGVVLGHAMLGNHKSTSNIQTPLSPKLKHPKSGF